MARLFVDMDGTLARFHDRILNNDGIVQIDLMYENGYFRNLEPFQGMVDGIKAFNERYPGAEVFILSAVADNNADILQQKNAWLNEFLPEIDLKHRIFTAMGEDKTDYINDIMQDDFLIDDYNVNLYDWIAHGGSAIKCVNNINHQGRGAWGGDSGPLWQGETVDYKHLPIEIAYKIARLMGIEQNLEGEKKETDINKDDIDIDDFDEDDFDEDREHKEISLSDFNDFKFFNWIKDDSGRIVEYEAALLDTTTPAGATWVFYKEDAIASLINCADLRFDFDSTLSEELKHETRRVDFGTTEFNTLTEAMHEALEDSDGDGPAEEWNYICDYPIDILKDAVIDSMVPDLDGGYAHLDDTHIVRPGEGYAGELFARELETDKSIWYGDTEEFDETGGLVMFNKEEDGGLTLVSNNYFSYTGLQETLEDIYNGKEKALFLPSRFSGIDEIAEIFGWEKRVDGISGLADGADDAISDKGNTGPVNMDEKSEPNEER